MSLSYEAVALCGLLINLVLASAVLRQNHRRRLNQVFAFFVFTLALWELANFAAWRQPVLWPGIPWEKVILVLVSLIAVAFFHFISLFIRRRIKAPLLVAAYISVIIVAALMSTRLLVKGTETGWFGPDIDIGPLVLPFVLLYYGLIILAILMLTAAYRKQPSPREKRGYAYIIAGATAFIFGLLINALSTAGLHIYPIGIFGSIIFSLLCAYAIFRYQLLDITGIMRKGTAYFLVSAVASGLYLGLLFLAYVFISGAWSLSLWMNIIFIFVLAIGLQPALSQAQKLVDRWFYRGRYDYLNALTGLADETNTITDLNYIAGSLVKNITLAMQCGQALVLLPDTEGRFFQSADASSALPKKLLRLPRDSALIWWLNQNKKILTRQDIDVQPQLAALTAYERQALDDMRGELLVPLLTGEGLKGILIVSQKISEEKYSPDELKLLRVVANQMATVVDNARLYDLQTRRYREQALLARLSMTVYSELDFNQVYASLMKEIREIMPVDYAVFMLLDEQTGVPVNSLEFSQIPELDSRVFRDLFTLDSRAKVSENGCYYDPDLRNLGTPFPSRVIDLGLRSLLYLPLKSKNNTIAYLALASREEDAYNEDYIRLLKQINVQLVIANEKSRLYELERKMRMELEKQDKERTEFINSLIHEIKTPITAMLASCDLLSEELASSSGILAELSENLSTSISNLNIRVSELTDFAKLQNTEIKIKLQAVDMNRIVEKVELMVSGLLQTRAQVLNCELKASPRLVKADPDRVIQILLNLLTNASKYSQPGQEINLRTDNRDGFLLVAVKDCSTPIAPEDRELLFRPYNLARKKGSGGLGLGLFICKRMVELHGGKIWLETDATGNQFIFTLPLTIPEDSNESSVN